MIEIDAGKFKLIKDFIFKEGRLLERKLFQYFFEDGSKKDVVKVLEAYQNQDGGFGHGIEPDLLCPDSTAIGAETALYILDLLNSQNIDIANRLIDWIFIQQNRDGYINHPPENFNNYPHQPWWKNPDDKRILILAGILGRWNKNNELFYKKVKKYYLTLSLPTDFKIYDYPYFVYLMYCSETKEDENSFINLLGKLPEVIKENQSHFPLIGRYWFYLTDHVKSDKLQAEANFFLNSIQEDGGVKIPFDDLPWWRPIFTLDGLIILKKLGLLTIETNYKIKKPKRRS